MGKSSSKLSAESIVERLKQPTPPSSTRKQQGFNGDFSEANLNTILDNEQLLGPFLTDIFYQEVEVSDSISTLFRGNCLASKIMSHCFRTFGTEYLKQLLQPHTTSSLLSSSYEIDSTKLDLDSDLEVNQKNLLKLTEEILASILSSADKFPPQLNTMCVCLRQVLQNKYPDSDETNLKAVGTVIFLRFINPSIVAPFEFGIVDKQPPANILRALMLVSKILQNIANNVEFSKEEHMLPFNDFVRRQFEPMRLWVKEISSAKVATNSD